MATAQQILEKAKSYEIHVASFLGDLVSIPSLSGEESEVVQRIATEMETVGFDEVRVDRLGNVIGRIGNGPIKIAMDAHIDTVDVGNKDLWSFDPFAGLVRDGKVWGRGAADQKGGMAAMVYGGRIIKELDVNGDFTLYVTGTVMEEDCDGLCWQYLIREEGLKPECVLITEPTDCVINRGQRGRMEIKVETTGLSAHGSAPDRGVNAIYKMQPLIKGVEQLNERLVDHPFLGKGTVVLSGIWSRSPSQCAVADGCGMSLDRRLTVGEDKDLALRQIRELAGGDQATVSMYTYAEAAFTGKVYPTEKYYPTWLLEPDHPAIRSAVGTYESLFGGEAPVGKWVFSTNGVAISGLHDIPCFGFGPGEERHAHAPNEYNTIEQLKRCVAFYAAWPSHFLSY